jgi:ATP-dependent HslUV protease ATP-binding subunit HslU
VRDLVEVAVKLVRDEEAARVRPRAKDAAEERVLDCCCRGPAAATAFGDRPGEAADGQPTATREKFRAMLRDGRLDDREVEIDITEEGSGNPLMQMFSAPGTGMDESSLGGLKDMLGGLGQAPAQAQAQGARRVDRADRGGGRQADRSRPGDPRRDHPRRAARHRVPRRDRQDRDRHERGGADVSREGVQRDLLPIVEGSTVTTKYGPVKTDHVLFIAAGAFHMASRATSSPSCRAASRSGSSSSR